MFLFNSTTSNSAPQRKTESHGYFALYTTSPSTPKGDENTQTKRNGINLEPKDNTVKNVIENMDRLHVKSEEEEDIDIASRNARLEAERVEATLGEEEWVRCGGVLRDSNGKRDFARTAAIKEELRIREVERKLVERWETYENRWKVLAAKIEQPPSLSLEDEDENYLEPRGGDITFSDIPWPVDVGDRKVELEDLTLAKVEEFLLGDLTVRGSKTTKKGRIRASLLRWHPDKLNRILPRVVKDDVGRVRQGVAMVIGGIQDLGAFKDGR